MAVGALIMDLGERRGSTGSDRDRAAQEHRLIQGDETPRSAVDALLFIGGNLSGGEVLEPDIQRESMHHVLGGRSVNLLLKDLAVTRRLLTLLQTAFPEKNGLPVKRESFQAEVESLDGLSAHAGQAALIDYATAVRGRVKQVYLVHGEEKPATVLMEKLSEAGMDNVHFPEMGEEVEIS